MKNMRLIALGLVLISLAHSKTWAETATLSWRPTTTDVNGALLTRLSRYKVYYGKAGSTYTQVIDVGLTVSPTAPAYTVTDLEAGNTYYFAVTAYGAFGNESGFSNEVSKTFANSVTTTTTTTVRPTTSTTVRPTTSTTTTIPFGLPSAESLSYTSLSGVAQSFTGVYSYPGGWENLSDATFYIAGGGHDQWLHYNPVTNSFSLAGANGECSPGQATTLSNSYLRLNCSKSAASGAGTTLAVTFSLTPQKSLSGAQYRLIIVAYDRAGKSNANLAGNWIVQLPKGGS